MDNFAKNQSKMDLFTIDDNTPADLECSVCCKSIQKIFFQCGAPCNKVFHVSCMEQMIDRTEEAAWEEDYFDGLEALGWSCNDTEYHFYGPLELTNTDTGESWNGE